MREIYIGVIVESILNTLLCSGSLYCFLKYITNNKRDYMHSRIFYIHPYIHLKFSQ